MNALNILCESSNVKNSVSLFLFFFFYVRHLSDPQTFEIDCSEGLKGIKSTVAYASDYRRYDGT